MNKRSSSLIKNTSILGFGTICTKGIMFILTPLFTRWLTTEEFGTFDLVATYVTLLIPVVSISIGEALFRFLLDEKDNNKESIISTAFAVSAVGSVVSIPFFIIAAIVLKIESATMICIFLYFLAEMIYNFMSMELRGEKRLNIYTVGNIAFVIGLAIFVAIFAFFLKIGLNGILLGYACSYFASAFIMNLYSHTTSSIKFTCFDWQLLKKMLGYSIPLIPNSISWWIVNVSDRTLISLFLGTSINAIYAVSNKIPSLCSTFFNVFHLSWQQNATESMSDEDRDSYYTTVFNNMTRIIGSICILVLGVNYWFFHLLFTEDYYSGLYQSPILVLAIIFSMLAQFIGGIYVAQMNSKKNGLTTAIAAVINIVVNFSLIHSIGLYAASISTLVAYFILFLIRFIDIKKSINLHFERNTLIILGIVVLFFGLSYINNRLFQIILLIVGFTVFILCNMKMVKQIVIRLVAKIRK